MHLINDVKYRVWKFSHISRRWISTNKTFVYGVDKFPEIELASQEAVYIPDVFELCMQYKILRGDTNG